jgi:hypothetical protein
MPTTDAKVVKLMSGAISEDGRHAALLFRAGDAEEVTLAISLEQFPLLLRAAALLHSQARKLHGENVRPIAVERWSTQETPETAVLSLYVFGGQELRFELGRQGEERADKAPSGL